MNYFDYKHIAAWGIFQHSDRFYIREQQQAAYAERAPLDVIFRRANGQWARYADVKNSDTKCIMDNLLRLHGETL